MGAPGCAAHFFDRKGVFVILAKGIDEDSLMSLVLDAGADDMQNERGRFTVTCDPASFQKVQEALAKNNITTETAEITMVAKMNVDVDAETARKITKLLLNLDDHDDVQNVHCNVHMSTEVLAELENE